MHGIPRRTRKLGLRRLALSGCHLLVQVYFLLSLGYLYFTLKNSPRLAHSYHILSGLLKIHENSSLCKGRSEEAYRNAYWISTALIRPQTDYNRLVYSLDYANSLFRSQNTRPYDSRWAAYDNPYNVFDNPCNILIGVIFCAEFEARDRSTLLHIDKDSYKTLEEIWRLLKTHLEDPDPEIPVAIIIMIEKAVVSLGLEKYS